MTASAWFIPQICPLQHFPRPRSKNSSKTHPYLTPDVIITVSACMGRQTCSTGCLSLFTSVSSSKLTSKLLIDSLALNGGAYFCGVSKVDCFPFLLHGWHLPSAILLTRWRNHNDLCHPFQIRDDGLISAKFGPQL